VIIAALARILEILRLIPTKRGKKGDTNKDTKTKLHGNRSTNLEPGTWWNQVQHNSIGAHERTERLNQLAVTGWGWNEGGGTRSSTEGDWSPRELKAARERNQSFGQSFGFNVPSHMHSWLIVPHTPRMAGMKKNDCVAKQESYSRSGPTSIYPSLVEHHCDFRLDGEDVDVLMSAWVRQ
jgi:hypothetical protein